MDKQKQLEKLQLEYELYSSKNVGTIDRTIKMVFRTLDEIDMNRSAVVMHKKRNRRKKIVSQALGKHAQKFGYSEARYYDIDTAYLDYQGNLLSCFAKQLGGIYQELDDDNYQELCRLLCFVADKNRSFISSVKRERRNVNLSDGTSVSGIPKCSEEAALFQEWFGGALEKASCVERVVKEKK